MPHAGRIRGVTARSRGDAFAPVARPGALVAGLVLWLAVTVVASSLAAPIAYWAVEALAPGSFPFERVFRRVAMLVALVHLIVWLRRSGVRGWASAGFTRAGRSGAAIPVGAAVGLGAAASIFALDVAFGARGFDFGLGVGAALKALAGGAAIGLLEEGVFRGALVFPFGRVSGWSRAAVATALCALYSTGHFARTRGAFEQIDLTSGFELWRRAGESALGSPEPWVGLFALGLLFDVLARRQGHVWGAVALHAGAVAGLQLCGDLTTGAPQGTVFFTNGLHPAWPLAAILALAALAVEWSAREGQRAPATSPESEDP